MNRQLSILRSIIVGVLIYAHSALSAQELNCTVELNTDRIDASSRDVFNTLRESMSDYLNTTAFTRARYSATEKIDCRIYFTVTGYSRDKVKGTFQVQSTRPVFDSSYNTTLLNIKDSDIEFEYRQHEQLTFTTTSVESDLTALLDFYAYLIIAVDADSFAPRGGQDCFDRLSAIVQQSQGSTSPGWRSYDDSRNRASILESFTSSVTTPIRSLIYSYHRQGLDRMSVSPDRGRASISATLLSELKSIGEAAPMSVALPLFRDSKLDEIINVYSKASASERKEIADLLDAIYPTEKQRIEKIRQ